MGGAGYAQDGSLAGCKLTPRYRGTVGAGRRVCFQIQRYTGLATGRVTPRSQDIKPPFGALKWSSGQVEQGVSEQASTLCNVILL